MKIKTLKNFSLIFIGTFLMGFAIVNFALRYGLADGGFSGITLIIYREFGVNVWISTLALNAPFLLVLFKLFDLKSVVKTIYGVVAISVSIAICEFIGPALPDFSNDMMVVAVLYGVIMGLGVGLVLKGNGTTGGSLLVVKILHEKWNVNVPKGIMIFDVIVISLGALHLGTLTSAIYTLIGIAIMTIVIAKVQEGGLFGYQVLIISDQHEKISQSVLTNLDRGATALYGAGVHSGHDKRILMVVIQKRELTQLKEIIKEIDPTCFFTVTHTYETIGEGFTYKHKSA